ncbi:hypothetical protein EV193_103433 [Herbihabitans rhizosphaerae]|uniref:Uncharacterized protein n=1 Tax=Herbihabitans rhizosphaerae TaxID=1872711 RepID=A0A4Q7KWH4_9PSEU|nr:hypothetical protein [Herbihabitans rhizosphaerae]RZS41114.1 hypothetical protein EV193_103433 [Herbihabitans rhizosphaerae]
MNGRQALAEELARLRKRRGVHGYDLPSVVGPALRTCCGITETDDQAVIRAKLAGRLSTLADGLPEDLRLAALAALALHPDARHPVLRHRLEWLAERIGKDERTARRRADEALDRLADLATTPRTPADGDWYVARFDALVRIDRAGWLVRERRGIVATRDGLDRIVASISLPPPTGPAAAAEPNVRLTHGGHIARRERPSGNHFRFLIDLPAALRTGDGHEYGLEVRVPPGRRMRPHYAFTPRRPCQAFDLRIRFDPARPPRALWRLDGAHIRVLDDGAPSGEPLHSDADGEVTARFADLVPGNCYGIQWTPR